MPHRNQILANIFFQKREKSPAVKRRLFPCRKKFSYDDVDDDEVLETTLRNLITDADQFLTENIQLRREISELREIQKKEKQEFQEKIKKLETDWREKYEKSEQEKRKLKRAYEELQETLKHVLEEKNSQKSIQ